jgi:hypothetical protein
MNPPPPLDVSKLPNQPPEPPALSVSDLPNQPAGPPPLRISELPSVPDELKPPSITGVQPGRESPIPTLPGNPYALLQPKPEQTIQNPVVNPELYDELTRNATSNEEVWNAIYGKMAWDILKRQYAKNDELRAANIAAIAARYHVSPVVVGENYDAWNMVATGKNPTDRAWWTTAPMLAGTGLMLAGRPEEGLALWAAVGHQLGWLALGTAGFEAEEGANRFIRSRIEGKSFSETEPYGLHDLAPKDADANVKGALDLLDMLVKFKVMHMGYNGLNSLWDAMAYEKLSQIIPSQKLYIPTEAIRNYSGAGVEGTEYYDILQDLKKAGMLNNDQIRDAVKYGLDVEVPLSKVVGVADRPWFAQVKGIFKGTPYREVQTFTYGSPQVRLHVSGELPAPALKEAPGGAALEAETPPQPGAGEEFVPELEGNGPNGPGPAAAEQSSGKAALDSLERALVQQESGGRDYQKDGKTPVVSVKGAKYAWQVLPSTAANPGFGIKPAASDTPEEYNRVGKELLEALVKHYDGDQVLALGAYNTGQGTVDRLVAKYGDPRKGEISYQDWISKLPVTRDENGKIINDAPAYVRNILANAGHESVPRGITRDQFIEGLSRNPNLTDEHIQTLAALADGIARSWAETYDRTPGEWFTTFLHSRNAESPEGAPRGDDSANAVLNRTEPGGIGLPEKGVTAQGKIDKAMLDSELWNAAKTDNRAAAEKIVDQVWSKKASDRLASMLTDPQNTLVISQPSTSGTNRIAEALAIRIAQDLGTPHVLSGDRRFDVAHRREIKNFSQSARIYYPKEYNPTDIQDLKRRIGGREVVIAEDVLSSGGSVASLVHTLNEHGIPVRTFAGLYGFDRLAISGSTEAKLKEGLGSLGINPEIAENITRELTQTEAFRIYRDIGSARSDNARQKLAEKLQGISDRRIARALRPTPQAGGDSRRGAAGEGIGNEAPYQGLQTDKVVPGRSGTDRASTEQEKHLANLSGTDRLDPGTTATVEDAEQIRIIFGAKLPVQTIVTIKQAQDWLEAHGFPRIIPQGGSRNAIGELLKNPAFQSLPIFDRIRVAAQLERPLREHEYSPLDQPATNKKLSGAQGIHDVNAKVAGSGILAADTVAGCDQFCFSCYGLTGAAQAQICHQHPVLRNLNGILRTGEFLRIGEVGDPSKNWLHTHEQVKALLQRSIAAGHDVSSAENVYYITKLLNVTDFNPETARNLQVSLDPFYPAHMWRSMEGILRIKAAFPEVNIASRVRSVETTDPDLLEAMKAAVDFCNRFKLPVLETRMRFNRANSFDLLSLDRSQYRYLGQRYKPTGSALEGVADHYYLCDVGESGCPACKNCLRTMFTDRPKNLPKQNAIIDAEGVRGVPLEETSIFDPMGGDVLFSGEGSHKGAVEFTDWGQAVIHLFENADVSTIVHELGHMLRRQLRGDDVDVVEKWAGVKNGTWAKPNEEKFARGFEKYVAEGVAPSSKLRSVFQKMKTWLLEIYKTIKNLRVRLNDDIRSVFDRMLSTEAERKSNVLYQMNDEYDEAPDGSLEAEALKRANKTAEEKRGRLLSRFEKDLRREAEANWNESPIPRLVRDLSKGGISRKSLMDWDKPTVTELIRRWPGLVKKRDAAYGIDTAAEYAGYEWSEQLITVLLTHPTKSEFIQRHVADGMAAYEDEIQLDEIELLAARVEAEIQVLKESEPSLADYLYGVRPEGYGSIVEDFRRRRVSDIATDTDYDNLKAAIRMAARSAKEAYNAGIIAGKAEHKTRSDKTKARFMEKALKEKLRQKELLENLKARIAAREEVKKLTAKISAISKATNLPIDYREQIASILSTVGARQLQTGVPAEVEPLVTWAQRKEEEEGEIFDIPYDVLEGIRGKTIREMSLDELRTLHRVLNEIYTKGRNEDKLLAAETERTVEAQAGEMAERIAEKHCAKAVQGRSVTYGGRVYPLVPMPGMTEAEKTTILGLHAVLEYGGKQAAIDAINEALAPQAKVQRPDEVIAGQTVSWAEQPAEEEIPEELRQALEQQLAAVQLLDEFKIKMPHPSLRPWAVKESRIRRIAGAGDRMLAELLEMETVLSWADGFTEDFGPNWEGICKPINDGYNQLYLLNNQDLPALEEILKPFKTTVGGLSGWANMKTVFPELGNAPLTKMEMMSWALNCGNEGNYNALKRSFKVHGRNLTDAQIQAVTGRLTKEEWDAVIKLGRLVDSAERFDQISRVYLRITGNRLTKVERWTVKTPYGAVDGWYYPLIDDPDASYAMEKRAARTSAIDPYMYKYNPKSPRSGFTIERKQRADHILDMNFPAVIARFLEDRNRYISLTLPVRDAQKLANNNTFRSTVEAYLGKDFHRMINPWLQDMARPLSGDTTWIERVMGILRRRSTMVHIGLKIITAIKHYPMLFTTIDRVGLPTVAKAFSAYTRHPFETRAFIEARDPFMRNLMAKWDRDIGETMRNFDPERSEARVLTTKVAFTPIDTVIGFVARVSWLASYMKAMKTFEWNEAKAIDYAQKCVRDTVGTFEAKDLAKVRRGSELRKLFTMFYPYGSSMFQRFFEREQQAFSLREGTTGTEDEGVQPSGWMRTFKGVRSFMWLIVAAGLVDEMMSHRKAPSPDEAVKGMGAVAANSVPFARDVVGAALGERPYEISPAVGFGRALTDIVKPVFTGDQSRLDRHLFENSLTALGYIFELPTDQIAATAEGIYNWGNGGYEPWNVLWKPPASGHGKRRWGR